MESKQQNITILVVDDVPENIQLIHNTLSKDYTIRAATSGKRALQLAEKHPLPDLILLDVMMPEMDGFETCKQLKMNTITSNIPIMFVTAKTETVDETKGFTLGAVDYISKPISPIVLKLRVETQLKLANRERHLEEMVKKRTQELEQSRCNLIYRLGKAAEFRDNETSFHLVRVSHYSKTLAEHIGMTKPWCKLLVDAAPMHDIGKIGVPDAVLLKPGRLTPDERLVIEQHPIFGGEILSGDDSPLLVMAHEIALSHHERWDGTGYPYKLAGEEIPLSARIVSIADVFDALTTTRPYKQGWPLEDAIDFIGKGSGTMFDPQLVSAFFECIDKIKSIYSDTSSELRVAE
ncbi:HD domain-containing phosphohydrolase [Psychromonas sp. MME2]|uniref:HD domain-containing phosphohydrolase n=1 Tax=unclassified Psychromonas TaxID=2614957 RepID=UPI00339CA691